MWTHWTWSIKGWKPSEIQSLFSLHFVTGYKVNHIFGSWQTALYFKTIELDLNLTFGLSTLNPTWNSEFHSFSLSHYEIIIIEKLQNYTFNNLFATMYWSELIKCSSVQQHCGTLPNYGFHSCVARIQFVMILQFVVTAKY